MGLTKRTPGHQVKAQVFEPMAGLASDLDKGLCTLLWNHWSRLFEHRWHLARSHLAAGPGGKSRQQLDGFLQVTWLCARWGLA